MVEKKYSHIDIYKLIFETSTEGILVCNREGEIKLMNDSIVKLFGYEREELVGQKVELLLPKEIKRKHESHLEGYSQVPKRKQMGAGRDLFGIKKNGEKLPLEISLNHMTIDGEFFVMALITDITTRKESEKQITQLNSELENKVQERTKELRENQILYSLIAKNFPNGIICVLNKELRFVFAEGEELIKNGVKGKFLLDKSYLDSFNKDNNEEVKRKLEQVFKGKMANFNIKKRKSVYEVHAVPLIYEKGEEITQILIVEHNVTKVKNIEEKMKQSLEREKELSELKSQFVSMASHEFRTPLSTILSSVNLIEKYDQLGNKEKKKVHVEKVKKNIKNLTNMLDDTLTISKIEENITGLELSPFNIIELLQEIITEMEGLQSKNQEVIINFAGEEQIVSDKKKMKIIFANVLSNALKYSEENVVLQISVENKMLSANIIDKGIGIPVKDQEHLFDRFYRAHNAANVQGTGLGLNIVNSYISIFDGEITIESKEDIGTNVSIKIPVN